MYITRGLGLDPSQYPPVPSSMWFTVTESGRSFVINSAQALSDYVRWVNANVDQNVKTSQDGIFRAENAGAVTAAIAGKWLDFISNPSKYATGSGGGTAGGGTSNLVSQLQAWLNSLTGKTTTQAGQPVNASAIVTGLALAVALGFIVWAVAKGSKGAKAPVAVQASGTGGK